MSLDDGNAEFRSLSKDIDAYVTKHYSEADTRVKFIDPFLTKCLGWNEHLHIEREESYADDEGRKCIDYTLSLKTPILIVEAKKNLKDFEIPETDSRKYKLDGAIKNWKNAWSAIQQAQRYAVRKGARYAVVTNGRQWIIFKAISEQPSWLNGWCLAYSTPDEMLADFTRVYRCISCELIQRDALSQIAFPSLESGIRQRARTQINTPLTGYRNDLYGVVDKPFRQVLLDVPNHNQDFLKECFADSTDTLRYKDRLNSTVVDPKPLFRTPIGEVQPGHRKDAFNAALGTEAINRQGREPLFVVMGNAGSGKTTFLEWYFSIGMPERARKKSVTVRCDFRKIECTVDELHNRTLVEVIDGITESAKEYLENFNQLYEAFRERIDAEFKGTLAPYSDDPVEKKKKTSELLQKYQDNSPKHLKTLIDYLYRKPSLQTIVILDNMDQKSPSMQNKLFQIAQELVFNCGAIVIIALREATYRKLCASPSGNAFSPVEFHVKSQNIDIVLSKRLSYLSSLLTNQKINVKISGGRCVDAEQFDKFINFLKRSFLGESADARLLNCASCISNSNLRRQLRVIYSFLMSGQSKMNDYMFSHYKHIPYHEFLYSIIHDDQRIFSERPNGQFVNIFEGTPQGKSEHFLCLRILDWFRLELGQSGELKTHDFQDVDTICNRFSQLGWSTSVISHELKRLRRFGLLSTESGVDDNSDEITNASIDYDEPVALTISGHFYANELFCDFTYFSSMAPDVALGDQKAVDQIAGILKKFAHATKIPINARIDIAKVFLTYLAAQESSELQGAISRDSTFKDVRYVPRMEQSLNNVLDKIP